MGRLKSMVRRVSSPSDRRVARQTIWMGSMTAVQFVGGIVHVSLAARILGPEGYGILAVFIAVTSLLHNFLAMPGGEVITTYVTRSVAAGRREEASATLRFALAAALGFRLVSYCLLVVFALTSNGFLGVERSYAAALIVFGVAGILIAARGESLAVLRLADRVWLGVAVMSVGTLTRIAVMLVAWTSGGGLFMIVWAYVAEAAVTGVGMFAAATISASRAGLPEFLRSLTIRVPRDVVTFQIASFGKSTIASLGQNLNVLLIAELSSASQLGLYGAARSIITSAGIPFRPITSAVQVEFSRQWYSSDKERIRRTALRFTLLTLMLASTGYGLLTVFHDAIILTILGADFSGAALPMLIMIVGTFVSRSTSVLGVLPAATGRAWPTLAAQTAGVLVSLAIILWHVPRHGAEGAAWANTSSSIIYVVVLVPFVVSVLRRGHSGSR